MKRALTSLLAAFLLASCGVGPNYKRPVLQAPAQFRGVSNPDQPPTPESLADLKWFDLFQDDVLKQLVTAALQENFDLRMAAERVLEAHAQLGITRSEQFPALNATAGFDATRGSSIGSI